MKVYTVADLQQALGIGKNTAYDIMRKHGFRTGYTDRSPLRITEEELKNYVNDRETPHRPQVDAV